MFARLIGRGRERQREEKRVVTKGRGQVMSKAIITVRWISKSGNTVQDCLGSRLMDSQHPKKQKTNWARETSRLMSGFVKSKSTSTKRRFPHKITARLCFQEMCVPQIDRTQKKMIKAAEAFGIGRPGRLTTCVNGLGFRRRTCLQPQEYPAVLVWTLPLNLFFFCDEQVVNVSTDDSIHTGVMKNGAATW